VWHSRLLRGQWSQITQKEWIKAMEEEIQSLNENKTFILTTLPIGKKTVGTVLDD